MNAAALIPPLEIFLVEAERLDKARRQAWIERRMARQAARWFVQQGKDAVKALRPLARQFDQNATNVAREASLFDWAVLLDQALALRASELEKLISYWYGVAWKSGAEAMVDDLTRAGIKFTYANPRAVAWAEGRAAAQVRRINETTRSQLNTLITNAVADGTGWPTLAKQIESAFEDFAGPPLFPSKKFRSRAQMVAAYETGDAMEAGHFMAAEELAAAGWKMQKKWLNASDERVRPAHRENTAAGWIGLDKAFPSGHMRPPSDAGCRCALVHRRARK